MGIIIFKHVVDVIAVVTFNIIFIITPTHTEDFNIIMS